MRLLTDLNRSREFNELKQQKKKLKKKKKKAAQALEAGLLVEEEPSPVVLAGQSENPDRPNKRAATVYFAKDR